MKSPHRHSKVSASALGYAISFMLLIGLICSGVLFVSSTNKRIELSFELDEHMLFNNYTALRFGAWSEHLGQKTMVHPSGDTTELVTKNWGVFKAVISTTHHNARVVQKTALVGKLFEEQLPALYLPNRKLSTKLCGETLLEGTVYCTQNGLERGYIAGQPFKGEKLVHGTTKESQKHLPGLKKSIAELNLNSMTSTASKIELFYNDSSFKFSEKTSLVSTTSPIYINQNIEGNVIFRSFDSIFVSSTANLNHVILIAPSIRFESGFSGCVQAIATERIYCERNAHLNYPSALVLQEQTFHGSGEPNGIFLEEGARILGGVLLTSKSPNFRNPVYLGIDQATIGGLVYNTGETEVQGTVIGSLYTDKLALKTGGGEYGGYLLNATLSSTQLPDEFVMPDWLKETKSEEPKLLTCF